MESVELDAYVLDTLMRDLVGHDRRPSAFLVYLHLWRRIRTDLEPRAAHSYREIAEGTGLSRRTVQRAIDHLQRRRLLEAERDGVTAVPEYRVLRPWAARGQRGAGRRPAYGGARP